MDIGLLLARQTIRPAEPLNVHSPTVVATGERPFPSFWREEKTLKLGKRRPSVRSEIIEIKKSLHFCLYRSQLPFHMTLVIPVSVSTNERTDYPIPMRALEAPRCSCSIFGDQHELRATYLQVNRLDRVPPSSKLSPGRVAGALTPACRRPRSAHIRPLRVFR